ncbi:hypothetical protein F5B18DRAFT_633687 [Nemania serpens]|nr:hypothetical protein F5B18DRAFT_633687 [Nemania serpens]
MYQLNYIYFNSFGNAETAILVTGSYTHFIYGMICPRKGLTHWYTVIYHVIICGKVAVTGETTRCTHGHSSSSYCHAVTVAIKVQRQILVMSPIIKPLFMVVVSVTKS